MFSPEEAAGLILASNVESENDSGDANTSSSEESDEDLQSSIEPYPSSSEDSNAASITDQEVDEDPGFVSKDGLYNYSPTAPQQRQRVSAVNLFKATPGIPRSVNSRIFTPLDCIKQFITPEIIGQIVSSTNTQLESETSDGEIWKWIGCNLFMGIVKSKNASVEEMYSNEYGIPYIRKCNCFYFYYLNYL